MSAYNDNGVRCDTCGIISVPRNATTSFGRILSCPHCRHDFCEACAGRNDVDEASDCFIGQPCPVHAGQVHGGEAQELRAGLERLLGDMPGGDLESNHEWADAIRALLDEVDARDALAHVEMQRRQETP